MSLGGDVAAAGGGSHGNTAGWILSLTAGGFIYIALVDILPGLLNVDTDDAVGGLWQLGKEVLAILAGIGLMVLVAIFE